MSSVWYIGKASKREISPAVWTSAIGSGSYSDSVWDATNGWSLPTSSFTTSQLNLLASDSEFSLGQPDGPRTSVTPNPSQLKDSALAYYQAAANLLSAFPAPSKLVNIADNSWGVGMVAGFATSTSGTSEQPYTIGIAATGIVVAWNHYFNGAGDNDNDPSGSISFNASIKVISSTNPGTTVGTIYRLTFGGRTTATLDPGARIQSDLLGLSLNAGDVVTVRTFLASGTAYPNHQSLGGNYSGSYGGFTATTDLTVPGSGAVTNFQGFVYGPASILGYAVGAGNAKSVALIGDSISAAFGEAGIAFTKPILAPGGWAIRALTGKAGLINLSEGGDSDTNFQSTNGSFRRLKSLERCNSVILANGANDFGIFAITASALETLHLDLATKVRRLGVSKVFVTTLVPRTTSTDAFATTTNQTPISTEAQRLLYNAWVRAKCPIDPLTFAPVSVGTPAALVAGQTGHPLTGFFDTAATVESSLNSGFWMPCNRVVHDAAMTSGAAVITSATANFVNSAHELGGDLGSSFVLFGAGAGGINIGTAANALAISVVSNATTVTVDGNASTTVSGANLNIGVMTYDGTHPSSHGHYLMSQAIDLSVL
jgi:hypothetical protein